MNGRENIQDEFQIDFDDSSKGEQTCTFSLLLSDLFDTHKYMKKYEAVKEKATKIN